MELAKRLLCVAITLVFIDIILTTTADDSQGRDEIGRSTAQLIRLRKFQAQNYNVTVAPGVRIELVRIINPKLRHGPTKPARPVLFIHGIISSSNYFLVNSIDTRPNDWTYITPANMTIAQLEHILKFEPTSNSLPFLLSNLGHDVWLVNRRPTLAAQRASAISYVENSASIALVQGFFQSIYNMLPSIQLWNSRRPKTTINMNETTENVLLSAIDQMTAVTSNFLNSALDFASSSVDTKQTSNQKDNLQKGLFTNYWNFSLDEQAVKDLPILIDYILAQSPRAKQVSTVSHSTGGAIMLMGLAQIPKMAAKIGKVALWAPAMDLGRSKDGNVLIRTATRLEPILRSFEGPVDPSVLVMVTELSLFGFCQTGQIGQEACKSMTDAFDGVGSDQLHSTTAFSLACGDVSGSHELSHLLQSIIKGQMHYYDFGSESMNDQIYGKEQVSVYDISKINFRRMSIWQGNTDALVTTNDTRQLIGRLRVPVDYRYIGGAGIKFDHSAFMLHKNVSTLINIPTLKFLEQD